MVLKAEQEKVRKEFEVFIKKELLKTWVAQGHNINGKVVKEMDIVVEQTLDSISFLFFTFPYGAYIESGVSANKIPFSGIGGGGKSAYIQGLIAYALKKLNVGSLQEAKSAAFAIAHTHKKQGMPSTSSNRFSSTGRRTGWIADTMQNNRKFIREFMFRYIENIITVRFDNIILKFQKEFKSTA